MWLFHPLGLASIVENTADPTHGTLLARGRFKGDLEKLFPGHKVKVTKDRDYLFRTVITRAEFGARLAELAAAITYPNFKNAAPKDRSAVYSRVWTALYNEQDRRAPKRRRGRGANAAASVPGWPLRKQSYYDQLFPLPEDDRSWLRVYDE